MRKETDARLLALTAIALSWGLAGCRVAPPLQIEKAWPPPVPAASTTAKTTAPSPAFKPPAEPQSGPPATLPLFSTMHSSVQRAIRRFQTSRRRGFIEGLRRGSAHMPLMKEILAEEGVPTEFACLPIVESNFRLNAVSDAGAVGPWQIMPVTGRHYGLRIDRYVDERRDPEKATRAAARYLRDLYERFGDWHLALAAYNTGEGRIASVRNRSKTDDYWQMSRHGYFPQETSRFVHYSIAAMTIAAMPEAYGLEIPRRTPPAYEVVQVDRSIPLQAVADMTGSSLSTISDLNPALRRGMVPPQGYSIRVPKGTRRTFAAAYARRHPPVPPAARGMHRARRGENLDSIARR